jgi:hypothetical protein
MVCAHFGHKACEPKRPGVGDELVGDRRARARHRSGTHLGALRRHQEHRIRVRHLRFAQHGDVGWCRRTRQPHIARQAVPHRRPSPAVRSDRGALRRGCGAGTVGSVAIAEIARVAHLRMDWLPPGVDRCWMRRRPTSRRSAPPCSPTRRMVRSSAGDPETGFIELLDFAVAEDCATMVNPMIVQGQLLAAIRQVQAAAMSV